MSINKLYKYLIFFIIPIFFLVIFTINKFFNNYYYFNDIFRLELGYIKYSIYYTYSFIFVFFLFVISKRIKLSNNKYFYLFLIILSLIIKLFIHSNNYDFSEDSVQEYLLNKDQGFVSYFLYEKISYLLLSFSNFKSLNILFYFNILLGSLTALIIFFISNYIFKNNFVSLIIYLTFLLYLAPNSIETLPSTDVLFNFLLALSILVSLKINDKVSKIYIISLLSVFILLAVCKEQAIYLLPLFVIYFLFKKKIIISILLIIFTLTPYFLLNYLSYKNNIIQPSLKNFHLTVKLMQYGYLSDHHISKLKINSSKSELILLNDIYQAYEKNIFPTKRKASSKFTKEENKILPYFKPYNQSIVQLNTNYISQDEKNKLNLDKLNLINELNKIQNEKIKKNVFISILDKNSFYLDSSYFKNRILNYTSVCIDVLPQYYNYNCVIETLENFYDKQIFALLDNWQYSKIGIFFNLKYLASSEKKFSSHSNSNQISNLILHNPILYLTQSALIFFGETPRFLNENIGIGKFLNYDKSNYLKSLLVDFNKLYKPFFNFFYVFSLLNILLIFLSNLKNEFKINIIFLNIFPIYYAFFLSFATFAEYGRLMIAIGPLQIINFFIFIFLNTIDLNISFKKK